MLEIKFKKGTNTLFEAVGSTKERADQIADVTARALAGAMTGKKEGGDFISLMQDIMDELKPEKIEEALAIAYSYGRAVEAAKALMTGLRGGNPIEQMLAGLRK